MQQQNRKENKGHNTKKAKFLQVDKCKFLKDFDGIPLEDLNKKFSESVLTNNTDDLNLDVINDRQELFSSNRVIFLTNSIILTVTHFCRTTYNIINSSRAAEAHVFLNEYSRRYKAYIDYAIYLNEELENLNVVINYLYDYFFKQRPVFSKFSFLRMLVSPLYLYTNR